METLLPLRFPETGNFSGKFAVFAHFRPTPLLRSLRRALWMLPLPSLPSQIPYSLEQGNPIPCSGGSRESWPLLWRQEHRRTLQGYETMSMIRKRQVEKVQRRRGEALATFVEALFR